MEQNRINLYQGMVADGNYHKDIDAFNSQYFSNDLTVKDLWKKLIKNSEYTKTLKQFYVKYACDLSWAKNGTYCKLSSIPSPVTPPRTGGNPSPSPAPGNGVYTTPGDPYQYKIVNCVWQTKGKSITDWKSLEGNQKAIDILDGRFPNARKDCNKTKPEEVKPVINQINLPAWATCIKVVPNLKLSQDSKGNSIIQMVFGNSGDYGYFWEDGTFLYVFKDTTKGKIYGKWSCKDNSLVVTTDDGQVWMSGSGWIVSPDKVETPDTNNGTDWVTPDELSDGVIPQPVKTESTMDNLENIINEVNSLIVEQTQEVVQAPADELSALENNPVLKSLGSLETLCRTPNQTSKPIKVNNGKTYFAGKAVTKKDGSVVYVTYDGMVIKRVGDNSCVFEYVQGTNNNNLHIKGVPFADLSVPYLEVLSKFGINPLNYDSDPQYLIKKMTTKLQDLITNQGVRSAVFKNWNDILTYWDPKGVRLTGGDDTFSNPTNDELNQYRLLSADNLGLKYLDKQVQIYIPLESAIITGAKKIKYEPVQCQLELKTYLTAAFEFQMNGQNDPNINVNTVREHLRGCYSHGMFDKDKFKGLQQSDLNIQFSQENNPFKWWKQGSVLSMNNIKELLTGSNKVLPTVSGGRKNQYLNFKIDTMNESKTKLDTLIKENLQKLSEQKNSNLLAETKIIQTRTKILTENRILKFKQPREKFFNEIISESIYLESQGFDKQLIKEEFWDALKGLFGQHGSEAIFGTFKEYMGKWLLQKLTPVNPDGWIGSIIVTAIGNLHIDDLSKLTDCNFLTKKIASSIGEGIARKIQHDKGFDGGISDIVRNGLFSAIDSNEMVKSLENGLAKLLCPALSGVKAKLENKAQQMKTMAIQA